jgi:2-polyprenyl-3-methyl-5-hydroxy-6-metoxy-1,4-benzoquinol methylase
MNKITNPIFKEFIDLKIINKKKIFKISNYTRDKKISVYKDRSSSVIFLERCITSSEYYKLVKYKNNPIKKSLKKNIQTSMLEDDIRRVVQFKKLFLRKKILDYGCGWGVFLKNIKKSKSLTGIELRKECISFIKKNIKKIFVTNNLRNLNGQKYDIITMFHVLEHMPHQVEILKSLKEKLSRHGKIIIEVPCANDFLISLDIEDFKKFTFWSEHLVLHTEKSLRQVLKKAGYKKIQITYYQRYNFANHLGWFVNKKPGGHDFFKEITDTEINKNYIKFLKRIKSTDTLIAIAEQ